MDSPTFAVACLVVVAVVTIFVVAILYGKNVRFGPANAKHHLEVTSTLAKQKKRARKRRSK